MEALNLTTIKKRIPVNLEVMKSGKAITVECYLLEMTGGERSDYLLGVAGKLNKDNTVQAKHLKAYQPTLISQCLFKPGGLPFPIEEITVFPPDTVKALFDACQDLIGISKLAKEAAEKN